MRAERHLSRQYAKLCDVRDFDDARLKEVATEILPERNDSTLRERKVWEFTLLALYLDELGLLCEETSVLSVGAGDERIAFWLANRCGRVVCTDVYGEGDHPEAEATMLTDPPAHAPFPYREDRLEVLWADAADLPFPAESFDVVYSLSAIEHFGQPDGVLAAAEEIGRVVRPGGHAAIATDCFVDHHIRDWASTESAIRTLSLGRRRRGATPRRRSTVPEVFTLREIRRRIVTASGLRLVQPLDLTVSPESWLNITRVREGGRPEAATGEYWPHILLAAGRSFFTSVFLPLAKD